MTNYKKSFRRNPIKIRDPEFRQRRERTKKERLEQLRKKEAEKEIRETYHRG